LQISLCLVTTDSLLKRTPLYAEHARLGAKLIGFGGWEMPVQYTAIIDEHQAVRNAAGVFDISHMGQFFVAGAGAKDWLNHLLANNVGRLEPGQCQYTFLLNESGGVIDDLIVYRCEPEKYLLVVNAALIDTDFQWMRSHLRDGVEFENRSDEFAGLAIQGPNAAKVFEAFFEGRHPLPAHNEIRRIENSGVDFFAARTGYTGEDGFEIFFPAGDAVKVWNGLLEKGAQHAIKPCGLGARDTLRLEMCYPLNGSDLSPQRTPLEAGLFFFVDLEKGDFIGRDAIVRQRAEGVTHRLVPFKMCGACPPPRAHYPVRKDGAQIAEVTSGSLSPSLNIGIGMAYIPVGLARVGEEIEIDVRGRFFPAAIQKKPLYKKP
ncbi:MAG TPA: glycine cleavage system aminomethyltransferase GcvT, partial [Chthoniobacteraceae bacterium]|nr:glycine cleavage system aminomethyltransferase GcvT [Chthoniobacteraceae bacterium]